ncbi:hypothetical protein [Enterococcus rivorum]|uniref:Uncharacterized protein n=1 Tax=Enterococcus rivorum TaxID=762845 RepID=A0A1E5KTD8_9ENTE|nr:hypothetical protein [Enterococcus rivorum]MBP2097990.1 hypothetical protein [Enterococcus rivorum]OEH81162.1 hypothetical protein BCR26_04760 [Enterococcus rivorum]
MDIKWTKKKFIGICLVLLFFLFIGVFELTKIERIFYRTDYSKTSYNSMYYQMKLISMLHSYKFESSNNHVSISKIGEALEYSDFNLMLFNSNKSVKVSKYKIDKIKLGNSYTDVKKVLGAPVFASKFKSNLVSTASWTTNQKSNFEVFFDDYDRVKELK